MRSETPITPEQMLNDIKARPTVPLWPHAGWAHGLSRASTYAAVRRGDIATIRLGRRQPALTGPLRKRLQIEG